MGSYGSEGRVTLLLEKILMDRHPGEFFIQTCGPKPMMKAVIALASKYGIEGEASWDESMACGVGACLTCVVKLKDTDGVWFWGAGALSDPAAWSAVRALAAPDDTRDAADLARDIAQRGIIHGQRGQRLQREDRAQLIQIDVGHHPLLGHRGMGREVSRAQ